MYKSIEWEYGCVDIPKNLMEHFETIAKEIHHSWMAWKIVEGFRYDPEKDYEKRQHPHFRAWEDLPEEHRASDYLAARAALKALVGLGLLGVPDTEETQS